MVSLRSLLNLRVTVLGRCPNHLSHSGPIPHHPSLPSARVPYQQPIKTHAGQNRFRVQHGHPQPDHARMPHAQRPG